MIRTKLSLLGTSGGMFFLSTPPRSTRAFDVSSNDFTLARVCKLSKLAHSPCHSCTTSLLETCAVKASAPPTVNVYGALSVIRTLSGMFHYFLKKVFQSKAKVPSCPFPWVAVLRHPDVFRITFQICSLEKWWKRRPRRKKKQKRLRDFELAASSVLCFAGGHCITYNRHLVRLDTRFWKL